MKKLIEDLEQKGELTEARFSAKDFEGGLRNQIEKMIKLQNTYLVVDVRVERKDGGPGNQMVSGSAVSVANWLADMANLDAYKKIKPIVKKFSTDRNWARKQADEV